MNQKTFNNILIVGIAVIIFLLTLSDYLTEKKHSENRIMMDTVVSITVYGKNAGKLADAADKAFNEIKRVENLLSCYIDTSDISKINNSAGAGAEVSEETMSILMRSTEEFGRLTKGAFDITLGDLIRVWGFTEESPVVPDEKEIGEKLEHVGYEKISIGENISNDGLSNKYSVRLADPQIRIDLGGIAKGYAIKMAAEALKKEGIKNALVDAGGDIVVIGDKKGKGFRIGIKSPDSEGIIGVINARDISVVTSGDYERFFIHDGVKYHHILDPKTGYPAKKCRSVTVMAKDAVVADALSTALFVMGSGDGLELVNKLPGVEALIIDDKNGVFMSKNALEYITLNESDESD